MTFTERQVKLPVWIILHPFRNWLSVGIARHYIHVSATFLSSRCRVDGSLGLYISYVFFEIHQPAVFHDFGADENGWKNCQRYPNWNHKIASALHLFFSDDNVLRYPGDYFHSWIKFQTLPRYNREKLSHYFTLV